MGSYIGTKINKIKEERKDIVISLPDPVLIIILPSKLLSYGGR